MAVKSLEMARDLWRIVAAPKDPDPESPVKVNKKKPKLAEPPKPMVKLRPEQELYFEMSLGSIYESSGKDDIAMSCYMRAS